MKKRCFLILGVIFLASSSIFPLMENIKETCRDDILVRNKLEIMFDIEEKCGEFLGKYNVDNEEFDEYFSSHLDTAKNDVDVEGFGQYFVELENEAIRHIYQGAVVEEFWPNIYHEMDGDKIVATHYYFDATRAALKILALGGIISEEKKEEYVSEIDSIQRVILPCVINLEKIVSSFPNLMNISEKAGDIVDIAKYKMDTHLGAKTVASRKGNSKEKSSQEILNELITLVEAKFVNYFKDSEHIVEQKKLGVIVKFVARLEKNCGFFKEKINDYIEEESIIALECKKELEELAKQGGFLGVNQKFIKNVDHSKFKASNRGLRVDRGLGVEFDTKLSMHVQFFYEKPIYHFTVIKNVLVNNGIINETSIKESTLESFCKIILLMKEGFKDELAEILPNLMYYIDVIEFHLNYMLDQIPETDDIVIEEVDRNETTTFDPEL